MVDFSGEHPVEVIRQLTGGTGVNRAIDAGGRNAPSQALSWAVEALAKAGTLLIIGLYSPSMCFLPIDKALNKNLTIKMGNCNHRKYISMLIDTSPQWRG